MLALCCRVCFSVVLLVRAGGVQQWPPSSLQSCTDFSPRLVNNIIGAGWGGKAVVRDACTSVFSTTLNTLYCIFGMILLVILWLFGFSRLWLVLWSCATLIGVDSLKNISSKICYSWDVWFICESVQMAWFKFLFASSLRKVHCLCIVFFMF